MGASYSILDLSPLPFPRSQALPGNGLTARLRLAFFELARRSLASVAFPGRAWERGLLDRLPKLVKAVRQHVGQDVDLGREFVRLRGAAVEDQLGEEGRPALGGLVYARQVAA